MRKFVKVAFVAVLAAIAGYGAYTSQKSEVMSDLAMANVEALAQGESPEVTITCGSTQGACWASSGDCNVSWFIRYDDCAFCGYMAYSCYTPC